MARAPLRRALDQLKKDLDTIFWKQGREDFTDSRAARDGYIDVILNRSRKAVRQFFRKYGRPDRDDARIKEALRLLEMQRNGMLMYTSCGWFFDEISGLEATQCLHYAARAIHLARHFGRDLEPKFVKALKAAPSNLTQFQTGRGVWEQIIKPAVVDLDRVPAHYAISLIFPSTEGDGRPYSFDLEVLDLEVRGRGHSRLTVGRLRVRSRLTWDERECTFVVIHYGGLDFHTVLRPTATIKGYEGLKHRLLDAYKTGALAEVTSLVVREFPGPAHRVDDLFVDEQRRIIDIALRDRIADYQRTYERLTTQDDDVLAHLVQMQYPIPKPLRAAASSFLDLKLREELARLEVGGDLSVVQSLYERGKTWGYQPERELLGKALSEALERTVDGLAAEADLPALAAHAELLLEAAALIGIPLDLWRVQNRLLDAYGPLSDAHALTEPFRDVCVQLAEKLNLGPDLLGWRP